MQRAGGVQRGQFRPAHYPRQDLDDDDSASKGTKRKHLRNALLTLVMLFGCTCLFVFLIAPTTLNEESEGLTAPIDGMVTDLVKLEKQDMNLRGATSSSSSSSSGSSSSSSSSSTSIENNHSQQAVESTGEEGSSKKQFDNDCLHVLPIDTGDHIVPPPAGPATLVCCQTTKGALNIAVHQTWAPIGAQHFLDLVNTNFFSTKVGLFRALKGFLIQFGLPGDPEILKEWNAKGHLQDDPSWLPLGPSNRKVDGITRYQRGYMAYAGAGKNSRCILIHSHIHKYTQIYAHTYIHTYIHIHTHKYIGEHSLL